MRKYLIGILLFFAGFLLWGNGMLDVTDRYMVGNVYNDTSYYVILDSRNSMEGIVPPGKVWRISYTGYFLENGGILVRGGLIKISDFLSALYKKKLLERVEENYAYPIRISEIVREMERNARGVFENIPITERVEWYTVTGFPSSVDVGSDVRVDVVCDISRLVLGKLLGEDSSYFWYPFEVGYLASWSGDGIGREKEKKQSWESFVIKLNDMSLSVEILSMDMDYMQSRELFAFFDKLTEDSLIWEKQTVVVGDLISQGKVSYVKIGNSILMYLHLGEFLLSKFEGEAM